MNEASKPLDLELHGCTFAKTVLMLIVLFYHSILYFGGTWFTRDPAVISPSLSYLAQWFNTFHIYGFALISGYLFYYGRMERGKYPTYGGFLLQKAKRLLVPYVFVVTLWVAPFHWFFFRCPFSEILDKYILGKSASQLWFLLMLFGVFAIFYPLANFFRDYTAVGAGAVLLSYAIALRAPYAFLSFYGLRNALTYLPIFWLGFVLRQYKDSSPARLLRKIPAPLLVAVHFGLYALWRYLSPMAGRHPLLGEGVTLLRFVVIAGGAVMAFSVLTRLASRVKEGKFLRLLTKCSMPIYLFHQQLVYIAVKLMNGVLPPYPQVPIVTTFALFGALGISVLLLKFRYTRPLVGEAM